VKLALGVEISEMKKSTIIIIVLSTALIGSNAWWAYKMLDFGVSYTYQGVSLEESSQALSQSLAIIKAAATPDANRDSIIKAARKAWPGSEPFEKEGYLWVGRLGLRFNEQGRLIEAVANN
jgi:hypothetical protein